MEIRYTQKAIDDLQSLPRRDKERIALKMRFYADVENPLEFAERLVDSKLGEFRFRIGEFRVVFDVAHDVMFILKIARRDKVYR